MDWLDLLAVQGTLKSLLQHHSSKAPIFQHLAFFYTWLLEKTIALPRLNFVDKVMPLLFNMLPRLVITFLLSSRRLLISWLQSPSAVILQPRKIKSATVSTVSLSICHEVIGPIYLGFNPNSGRRYCIIFYLNIYIYWSTVDSVSGEQQNDLAIHEATGKTVALTWRTFVGKVMSLLFNMLSRLVITFLPRSKRLLISWLQ